MEAIEIADGQVKLVQKNVVKTVSIRDFKTSLLDRVGFRTQILPPGTVLYAQRDQMSLYVLEQPPGKRAIKHREGKKRGDTVEYTIPLPWVYFLAVFKTFALDSVYVFFRPSRLEDLDSDLFFAPLPNMDNNGLVCLGGFRFSVTSSLPSKVANLTGYYWGSTFNHDLSALYHDKMPREIRELTGEGEEFFAGWQKLPEDQACKAGWHAYKSLDEVLSEVLGEEEDDT